MNALFIYATQKGLISITADVEQAALENILISQDVIQADDRCVAYRDEAGNQYQIDLESRLGIFVFWRYGGVFVTIAGDRTEAEDIFRRSNGESRSSPVEIKPSAKELETWN